ncbi:hypothetical protein DMC30DRAFT_46308 [Rhodotorula diobovata]|uniref:Meiosis protein SPO22/ZIP4 like-domain-containing protein n=1 Tax=Rhodotorula diobovata TaxID=5288 RepID=A0A5C5G304_9BASI|nr:hypothetical protein DMC30DRAFT_46308 [Rhodotorula diobovata]
MAPPARQQLGNHAGPSAALVLVETTARLRAQLAQVEQLTSADARAELGRELATLDERLRTYEAAAASAAVPTQPADGVASSGWKDELDSKGTQLWNRSTALKHAHPDDESWLGVVAGLRLVAYRLIRLGAIEPLSSADRVSHLSLATKAATALLDAGRLSDAEPLMTECAKLVTALEQDAQPPGNESVRHLLAYFCFRMRFSLTTSKISLVSWAVNKAQTLLKASTVLWRDVEHLVHTLIHVASALVQSSPPSSDDELNNEMGREWLQWALELLEAAEGQDARALQAVALRLFAQFCLAAKSDGELVAKAETALRQVLELDPSPALHRRVVKLVIVRGASDAEVAAAFLAAAKATAVDSAEGALCASFSARRLAFFSDSSLALFPALSLLATLEQLPASRKSLRMQLLEKTVSELSTWGIVHCDLLKQVVVAAAVLASEADKRAITLLLNTVQQGLPTFRLSPAEALTGVTILRRLGDKASSGKRFSDAADWFLLATSSVFRSLPFTTTAKSIRKAALCFLEVGQDARVEEVMQLVPSDQDEAKDCFLRFCACRGNVPKALATLKVMISAPGFSPKLLQWAYKLAAEQNDKNLAFAITELLCEVCQAPEVAAQLDYMVLTRSVIRQHVVRLQGSDASDELKNDVPRSALKQLQSGLLLARRLKASNHPPASLVKEITWLYKTSFNLGAEFCGRWTTSTSTGFFDVTVALIELASQVGGDVVDASKLWTCRLAVVSGKFALARETGGGQGQTQAYKELLNDVNSFLESLDVALASTPQLEKAEQLLETGYADKVAALVHLEDWPALVELLEAFEDHPETAPLPVLKLIVDTVTKSKSCPLDHVGAILRKTLALLYGRQDLDVSSMAMWLRMLVHPLVIRRELDHALDYVQNAQQFIEQHKYEYPEDESSWMLSTAWDEGLNAFAASSPIAGTTWCSTALEIARAVDSPLVETIESQLEQLKARYVVKEEEEAAGALLLA